ncbi:LPS assembly lipoprotein LptE [Falsiporphyromonas endometrii]|uniref:LPS assembly lipoprotein LptE n=1 Tax=Falsiporphyromonas endometrii TaxID=1387297 RepID=A0ABV9K6U1_9PORP
MKLKAKYFAFYLLSFFIVAISSCSIQYKFDGASIDYSTTKTMTIETIVNQASHQYAPMSTNFTEALKNIFISRTKLEMVPYDGDLQISGAIVTYDLAPTAIQENAISAKTKFTIGIKIKFVNKVQPSQSFEKTFTEFTDFDSNIMFNTIEGQLVQELSERIIKQIYSATVENW